MNDEEKTKKQLIQELVVLRQRNAELEAAEEELKESENRLSTFMEYLLANITITDHTSRFLFANKRMRDLFDTDNWIGKTAREYFPPEFAERVFSTDQQVLEQGPLIFEEAVPIKTGEVRILETRKFPIKREGKPDLIGIISLDITERKRVEEKLAEERNLLRTLIDNLPDLIYFKDTKSRFILGNTAVTHIMGATKPDEIIGKTDFDFYPQELAAQYYADEQEVIRSGQPLLNREEPIIDPSGNRTWILTTKVPLRDNQGETVGLVGIGHDITGRKQVEKELEKYRHHLEQLIEERTAELSKANAELTHVASLKDEFLAMMSHELRTPLNVILGMSEILQDRVYGTLNEQQSRALHMIEESGRHLLEIITDILELSEMRTGKMKLDIELVATELICQTSLRLISQLVQKKKLKVSLFHS